MKFPISVLIAAAAIRANGFSRCINPLPEATDDDELSSAQACKRESKEHAEGEKTAYSRPARREPLADQGAMADD
jgi:hypothetical protein